MLSSYLSGDTAPDHVKCNRPIQASIDPGHLEEVDRLVDLLATCGVEDIVATRALLTALSVREVLKPTKLLCIQGKCSLAKTPYRFVVIHLRI